MHRTVSKALVFTGIGLHGGQPAAVRIRPASSTCGIVFVRSDVDGQIAEISARFDLVSDTRLCTKLTNEHGTSVSTIEHLMAALAGSGVSDAVIEVDGPEVPILDGSSLPFIRELNRVGLKRLGVTRRAIKILTPVVVESEGRIARLLPAAQTEFAFSISFDDPAIGTQDYAMTLSGDTFASDVADCRTFCMLSDVVALREIGLARGGGLENAIVVDKGRVLNPEGLRRPDEFVRHKLLDAIGDVALAGAPIIGRYEGVFAGHEMNNRLVHALFAERDAWKWVDVSDEALPDIDKPIVFERPHPITVAV